MKLSGISAPLRHCAKNVDFIWLTHSFVLFQNVSGISSEHMDSTYSPEVPDT